MRVVPLVELFLFRCIYCVDVCFSVALRFLGPVLVVVANTLVLFVTYEYLTVLVPR